MPEEKVADPKVDPKTDPKADPKVDPKMPAPRKARSVGELLEDIVKEAFMMKASDIHLEPQEKQMNVRYRVDGLLQDIRTVDKLQESALIFKIKVASNLRTDEHFAPQDGRIGFIFGEVRLDTRVSIIPTTKGEKVVMRLLTKEGRSFTLEDLGMSGRELEIVQRNYAKPYGMIVASGPTGSGKTTTLYSMLKVINTREVNITTIEDPVEYDIDGVNHIQVNPKAELTFATGLRSMLRQDPNIIMVGEIRDNETARIAINAALTGHLVLSTVHTNDAVTTIPRFVDMGVERYLVATTVNVIIAQRLARKLCEKCRKKSSLTGEKIEEIKKYRPDVAALIKTGEDVYEPVGCEDCHKSGYKGRVGLYEVLEMTKKLRDLVSQGATTDALTDMALKEGLVLMVQDGINKVKDGRTSISEVLRVTALRE